MPDDNLIGHGTCPVCRQPEARFTLSKSRLVVCTCRQPRCGIQLFSRNGDADEKLRAFIGTDSPKPAMPSDPPPPAAPAPSPKPASVDPLPDDDVLPPAPPKTVKQKPAWGLLGAKHG